MLICTSKNVSALMTGLVLLSGMMATAAIADDDASDAKPVPQIGFLSDYDKLQPVADGGGAQCWRTPDVARSKYSKVLIEHMEISIDPNSKQKSIDPQNTAALTQYFHDSLVTALQPTLQEVQEAGPDVLRIRIALTDLIPTNTAESVVDTVIPFGFVVDFASGAATKRPAGSAAYLGETGFQAQFRDGGSGKVIAECADTSVGRKYAADLNHGAKDAAKTWASGYADSFSTWAYARQAFDQWSALLEKRLQSLRDNP
jgi:hypothetical protein